MPTKQPTFKIPKSMAEAADLLYTLRQERLEADKAAAALKKNETVLVNYFIDNLSKSDTTGISGRVGKVKVETHIVPKVDDWDAFWKGFNKDRDRDLLGKSISKEAVRLRWEANKVIPGVGKFNAVTLSVTKA